MNTVTIFRGTLPKNFLGNVIYQFQLPCSCMALHIRLICHLQDRKEAASLHEKEAEAAFFEALKELIGERDLTVVRLYLASMPYKEISEKLGISAKKVDNTIYSAKKKIARLIADIKKD